MPADPRWWHPYPASWQQASRAGPPVARRTGDPGAVLHTGTQRLRCSRVRSHLSGAGLIPLAHTHTDLGGVRTAARGLSQTV